MRRIYLAKEEKRGEAFPVLLEQAVSDYLKEAGHEGGMAALTDGGILSLVKKGPHGKPYIPALPEFYFNFSHDDVCAALVTDETDVGVDIERIRMPNEALLRRMYTEEEQAAVKTPAEEGLAAKRASIEEGPAAMQAGTEEERALAAIRIWTKKESYLKMLGAGFSVHPAEADTIALEKAGSGVSFFEAETFPGFCMTVCRRGEPAEYGM